MVTVVSRAHTHAQDGGKANLDVPLLMNFEKLFLKVTYPELN